MSRKRKMTGQEEQVLVSDILAQMSEAGVQPTVLGLLQFGSNELLKEAIAGEITEYLGRRRYGHHEEGQSFKGYRNGYRKTTIDLIWRRHNATYEKPILEPLRRSFHQNRDATFSKAKHSLGDVTFQCPVGHKI